MAKTTTQRPRVLMLLPTHAAVGRRLLQGAAGYARQADWALEQELIYPPRPEVFEEWNAYDGVIATTEHEPTIRLMRESGRPAVLASCPPVEGLACFVADNHEAGQLAAEHLLNIGHRDLGYYSDSDLWFARGRAEGLRTVAEREGVTVRECWWGGLLEGWLTDAPKPIGILAANDAMAVDLSRACRRQGIAIPEEVSIIGVDDDDLICEIVDPPLSSVSTGSRRVGHEAAAYLRALMDGAPPQPGMHVVGAAAVVPRRSTQAIAVDHPDVRRALRFIHQHATEGIIVADVAEAGTLTRRRLEQLFRQHLDRSIHDEIARVRTEHARYLLQASDLTVTRIAGRCGFRTPSSFSVAFQQMTGESPSAYRRRARSR